MFCQHYETTALDASLLLMPLLRFLPPDDPRIRATVLAIAGELTQDGLVLRYQVDQPNGTGLRQEGTFTILSFWLEAGCSPKSVRLQQARDICERSVRHACRRSTARRSTPCSACSWATSQAFTHLALINAVMHVIRKEQAAHRRAMGREVPEGEA